MTLEDIGNIVVAVKNGVPVLVKDVATVEIGHAPRLGQFGFNKSERRGRRHRSDAHAASRRRRRAASASRQRRES